MQRIGAGKARFRRFFLTLSILSLLLTACVDGRGDWAYDLPNGYQVFRVNSKHVYLIGPDHDITGRDGKTWITDNYIGSYVSAFCYNEQYVGAQQLNASLNAQLSLPDRPASEPWFYLLDTSTGAVIGPMASQEEFQAKCEMLQIADLCQWIDVKDLTIQKAAESPFYKGKR